MENERNETTKLFQDVLSVFPLDRKLLIDLPAMLGITTNKDKRAFYSILLKGDTVRNPNETNQYGVRPENLEEIINNLKFYITSTKNGEPCIAAQTMYTLPSGREIVRNYSIMSKGHARPEGYHMVMLDTQFRDYFNKIDSDKMLLFIAKEVKYKGIEYLQSLGKDVPYSYWRFIEKAAQYFRENPDEIMRRSNIRHSKTYYNVSQKDGTFDMKSFSSMDLYDYYIRQKNEDASVFEPPTKQMPDNWLTNISPTVNRPNGGGGGKRPIDPNKPTIKKPIWEFQDFLKDQNPRMSSYVRDKDGIRCKAYVFPSEEFGHITFVEGDRWKNEARNKRTYVLFGDKYDSILSQDIGKIITATREGKASKNCFGIQMNHDKSTKIWRSKVRWLLKGGAIKDCPFVGKNAETLKKYRYEVQSRKMEEQIQE